MIYHPLASFIRDIKGGVETPGVFETVFVVRPKLKIKATINMMIRSELQQHLVVFRAQV